MIVFLWICLVVLVCAACVSGLAAFAEGMSDAGDDGVGDLYFWVSISFLAAAVVVTVLIVRHYLH